MEDLLVVMRTAILIYQILKQVFMLQNTQINIIIFGVQIN